MLKLQKKRRGYLGDNLTLIKCLIAVLEEVPLYMFTMTFASPNLPTDLPRTESITFSQIKYVELDS